ncbi:MAG: DUF3846 domain-containing protein [Erysipelotrichaceae bacterium]|nr:DUF3846 domain-containing protein [Erysipelotrichaceae bacterium]
MNIKGILVKAGEQPKIVEFEESLESLQSFVGGYIEMIQLTEDEDVDIVINEEGKLLGLDANRILMRNGQIVDVLVGDLIVVGANPNTGETVSVPEHKIPFFMDMFSRAVIEI